MTRIASVAVLGTTANDSVAQQGYDGSRVTSSPFNFALIEKTSSVVFLVSVTRLNTMARSWL